MADTVIELDLSVPWEPPEPPAPRRRLRARWMAVAAVLAVTLGVLVTGAPRPDSGRLYAIDFQVLRAQVSGGRLLLARYQLTGPGPMIEARRASDGKLLWERSAEVQQQIVVSGPDVVILMSEDGTGGDSSGLVVLDAGDRQGAVVPVAGQVQRHQRRRRDRRDVRDAPPHTFTGIVEEDPGVNAAGVQPQQRFLGLSARTGATAWDVTVPEGHDIGFGWDNPFESRLDRFDVLSPTGQLTRRDARTGAVTATRQLDWSGVSAMVGGSPMEGSGGADRLIVYPAGQRGAVVYDLATGRSLFRWTGENMSGLFRCTARLFCTNDAAGLTAVDITTGERRWHIDGQGVVVGFAGQRLLVGAFSDTWAPQPMLSGIVDGRTGAVVKNIAGWRLLSGAGGGRPPVWRPVDERTAVLGELDPATGTVTTFAQAENWFGNPECSVDGRTLACIVGGELSVWRLPNGH